MLIPYIRSSLLGNLEFCQHQCVLTYAMGFESKAGAAASMGSAVHKMMELRALASIAQKRGATSFEYENWGTLETSWALDFEQTIDRCHANQLELDYHVKPEKIIKSKVLMWAKKAITDYPQYDPVNLNIIAIEQYFDMEIREDWAKYDHTLNGVNYSGYMKIKGTIDCILSHSDDIIEVFDYKSGSRKDFATDQIKDLEYLKTDKQLLFYAYALNKLYPNKTFIMTLYFINDGGIYSVVGDDEMLQRAEDMIKAKYLELTMMEMPTVRNPKRNDFKCIHCCAYSKPANYTRGLSVCEFMQNKFKKDGLEATIDKYINVDKVLAYGSGGGKVKDE